MSSYTDEILDGERTPLLNGSNPSMYESLDERDNTDSSTEHGITDRGGIELPLRVSSINHLANVTEMPSTEHGITDRGGIELPLRVSSINHLANVTEMPSFFAAVPAEHVQHDTSVVDSELEALQAIYPDEEENGFSMSIIELPALVRNLYKRVQVNINRDTSVVLVLPYAYPTVSPVVMKTTHTWLTDALEGFLAEHFRPGSEILLDVIQFVRDTRGLHPGARSAVDADAGASGCGSGSGGGGGGAGDAGDDMAYGDEEGERDDLEAVPDSIIGDLLGTGSGTSSGTSSSSAVKITHGQPLVEKKSVFIAHVAQVQSLAEVKAFRAEVLSDKKVAKATHNIFAFRWTDPASGIMHHDCDDDGETAAAGRLAEMLRLMGLASAGSAGVAVIVSRWYGGVKLGPDRFKLINNCARKVLEECGLAISGAANSGNNAANVQGGSKRGSR